MAFHEDHPWHRIEKIDAHVHYNVDRTALLDTGKANGFRLVTINTEIGEFISPEEQQNLAIKINENDPGRLHFITTFRTQDFSKPDRKSTRLNSSHVVISYDVFCLTKKITI